MRSPRCAGAGRRLIEIITVARFGSMGSRRKFYLQRSHSARRIVLRPKGIREFERFEQMLLRRVRWRRRGATATV
jgi:hypothetical protein